MAYHTSQVKRRKIMKTKQILMLTLLLLGVSLAREAQAFYNPSTGRWLSRDPIEEEGHDTLYYADGGHTTINERVDNLNGYAFVRNNPAGFIDRFGLSSSCPTCGPNVTSPLAHLISKLDTTWTSIWTSSQRDKACTGLVDFWDKDPVRGGHPAWENAWGIDRLWRGNQAWINSPPYCPPCATQPTCVNTVQVLNQCYYAGSVNYVLFGHMCKLCSYSKRFMISLIWGYKHNADNYKASRDWAVSGYDGWPTRTGNQPVGDRAMCSPTCTVHYKGPPFQFYWYPNGWNERYDSAFYIIRAGGTDSACLCGMQHEWRFQ